MPFEIYYAAEVPNVEKVEKSLHNGFVDHRISPKREFFRMNPELVIAMLQMVDPKALDLDKIDVPTTAEDKEEQEILKTSRRPAPRFNFTMLGIEQGEELIFVRDDSIKCSVVSDREVEYQGKKYFLSSLSQELLGYKYGVQGPNFWIYKGKLLTEIREEKEFTDNEEESI
ncbi:MAG: GIY-YIG nuclease family protein [Brevinema sp.]